MEYEEYKGYVVSMVAVLDQTTEELVDLPDRWLQPIYEKRNENPLPPIRIAQKWVQERDAFNKLSAPVTPAISRPTTP